jgi:hypothetical protein
MMYSWCSVGLKVCNIGLVGVPVEGNSIIQVGNVGGFFKVSWVSYFYFHSSLGLEVEDVAMEGLSRGEVWD